MLVHMNGSGLDAEGSGLALTAVRGGPHHRGGTIHVGRERRHQLARGGIHPTESHDAASPRQAGEAAESADGEER